MKKFILLTVLICGFLAINAQKTTGGNYTYIAQRYEWLAGIFQALGLPAGSGPAAFRTGQEQRAGAVYYDSLGADAGFYIYTGTAWVLQGSPAVVELPDELIQPGRVIYSGTGLKFYITPSIARIGGVIYGTTYDSVTLSPSDPDDPRKDVIYVATTGIEVLTGTPAGPAAEPQLDAGQIKLTVVDIPALATTPGLTQSIIYDENTESIVTAGGSFPPTIDADNTTNPYHLTKAVNVTSLVNDGTVIFTLPSTIDLNAFNGLVVFIKLKAPMTGLKSIAVSFDNGTNRVSNEIILAINKSSTDWQGAGLSITDFSFTNTFIDKVRIRYIGSGSAFTGYYLDYIYLQSGLIQAGSGSTPPTVGPIDTKTLSPNGSQFEGTILYNQTATQSFPGLISPADKTKLDSLHSDYFIDNAEATYNQLAIQVNDSTVGIKTVKDSTGIGIVDNGTYLSFYNTGGAGGGGLSEVIAGYGLQNVNDSTLDVDSLVIANRDWVMDRIADIDTANLLFDSLGAAGISPMTTWDNTLYARRISISGGSIDTTASGGLLLTITPSAGGITTLNTLTDATQTFATGTTGTNFNISSAAGVHTFHIPDASAANRGLITTGTQTIAGQKTMSAAFFPTNGLYSNTTALTSNLAVNSGGAATSSVSALINIGGSNTVANRILSVPTTAYTMTSASPYAGILWGGDETVTEFSSGTHTIFTKMALRPLVINNGAATSADATTFYVPGPPTGTAVFSNIVTAMWIDAGPSRFDGIFNSNNVNLTANQIWGATSGATAMEGKTLTNGQNIKVTHGAGTATFAGATLTKNATIENPGAAENIGWFRTPVAITVTDVTAVLVGSGSPSVTYQVSFGTDITSLTNVYSAGQTVTSVTTGTAASGVNDATIPANSWVRITTSAQSGTVGQISLSIIFTED